MAFTHLLKHSASLLALMALWPAGGISATLEVGPNKPYPQLSDAVKSAHDGDTIRIAAGSYFDCAILAASNLTIQGAGPNETILREKTCNGKAILVADGNNITVRDLTLTGARVPDFNGAGIRAEGGDLTVRNVRFINNQEGVLGANLPGHTIRISDSEFVRNGTCEGGGCAHGVYVGALGLLHIEHSKFFETKSGHHIKSRAQRTEVIDCNLEDGATGTSSYAIEIPNGGSLIARDNTIQKGPKAENHAAAIMIGAEGVTQPTDEITVEHNSFLVEGSYNSFLLVNITATEARLIANRLQGNAKPLKGDGTVR